MRSTTNRSAWRLGAPGVAALAALALISGCAADDEVRVSDEAVRATSAAFTGPDHPISAAIPRLFPPRVPLRPADAARLSRATGVGADVLEQVSPTLHRQSAWIVAYQRTVRTYRLTPADVRDSALNLACQTVTGQITTAGKLQEAIEDEAVSLALSPFAKLALYHGVDQLIDDLAEATESDSPQDEAAAVMFCYTFDQITP